MHFGAQFQKVGSKVRAIITGGASGISEDTARLFFCHGAKVVIADIQDELGRSICDEIGSKSNNPTISYVTSEFDVQNAINITISKHNKLDIVFSNACLFGNFVNSILVIDILKTNIICNLLGIY